jgi:hypothetical protein
VIRSRKAGDFGAFGIGLLCLTSLDPNQGVRGMRVSPYAIGTGYQNASVRPRRWRSAKWHGQPACVGLAREQCSPPRLNPICRNKASQRLSSLLWEGKRKLASAGSIFSQTLNRNSCCVQIQAVQVTASLWRTTPLIACCNRLNGNPIRSGRTAIL